MKDRLLKMKKFTDQVKDYCLNKGFLNKDQLGNIVPNLEHIDSELVEIYMELALFTALVEEGEEEAFYQDMNTDFDQVYKSFQDMEETFYKLK